MLCIPTSYALNITAEFVDLRHALARQKKRPKSNRMPLLKSDSLHNLKNYVVNTGRIYQYNDVFFSVMQVILTKMPLDYVLFNAMVVQMIC